MTRTVVVRLFEPAPATGRVELRGVVEDVARRSSEGFAGTAELVSALERIATNPTPTATPDLPDLT